MKQEHITPSEITDFRANQRICRYDPYGSGYYRLPTRSRVNQARQLRGSGVKDSEQTPFYPIAPDMYYTTRFDPQEYPLVAHSDQIHRAIVTGKEAGVPSVSHMLVAYFQDETHQGNAFVDGLLHSALAVITSHADNHFSELPVEKAILIDSLGANGLADAIARSTIFLQDAIHGQLTAATLHTHAALDIGFFQSVYVSEGKVDRILLCPQKGFATALMKEFAQGAVDLVQLAKTDATIASFLQAYTPEKDMRYVPSMIESAEEEELVAHITKHIAALYTEGKKIARNPSISE